MQEVPQRDREQRDSNASEEMRSSTNSQNNNYQALQGGNRPVPEDLREFPQAEPARAVHR